ncbi:TIGR01777 family oxidoreductase [Desulfomicrobium salsuginis]
MKILAFGATGFVGEHLVPHLVERGHEVTVAARSGKARFAPPVVVLKADPTAPGPWQDLVAGFDAVVNLAGTPVTTRWDEAGKKSILESRVLSARNIVDALSRTAGKTFLCASAVGYYGDGGDKLLTEDAPRGTGFLADVAATWEAEARRAESFGHRVVMPRISVVLGDGGALAKMHLPFSLGLGGRLGNGKQWFPWIHIRDLVRAMSFLLENPAARGAFNACAPEAVTNAGFTASLARALKRPAVLPVPPFALRLVMGEAAAMLLSGQRCVPAALQALGFAFEHPNLDRALADIVPALKKG